jgi:hypothetical protein
VGSGSIIVQWTVSNGVAMGFPAAVETVSRELVAVPNGSGFFEAVGYYPTSIYNGGQLSQNLNMIQYGGEVANSSGGDSFPQMGSGDFAENGFGEAAFQNQIFYIPQDEDAGLGVWADLSIYDQSPVSCYKIELAYWPNGGDWGTYFYFGGPGGLGCA